VRAGVTKNKRKKVRKKRCHTKRVNIFTLKKFLKFFGSSTIQNSVPAATHQMRMLVITGPYDTSAWLALPAVALPGRVCQQ
jgi:hypothetical protein